VLVAGPAHPRLARHALGRQLAVAAGKLALRRVLRGGCGAARRGAAPAAWAVGSSEARRKRPQRWRAIPITTPAAALGRAFASALAGCTGHLESGAFVSAGRMGPTSALAFALGAGRRAAARALWGLQPHPGWVGPVLAPALVQRVRGACAFALVCRA
jgi:hypothetical protein